MVVSNLTTTPRNFWFSPDVTAAIFVPLNKRVWTLTEFHATSMQKQYNYFHLFRAQKLPPRYLGEDKQLLLNTSNTNFAWGITGKYSPQFHHHHRLL